MAELYKKLQRNGLLLFGFMYITLSLAVCIFSFYQLNQIELKMLTNELIESDAYVFTLDGEYDLDWREAEIAEPFTVFKGEGPFKGVFFKKDKYTPPIIEGRYFTEDDFYTGQKVAVVGKSVDQSLIETIEEQNYEIIGEMGASYTSRIDHLIFLNIDSLDSSFSNLYKLNANEPRKNTKHILFGDNQILTNEILLGEAGTLNFIGMDDYNYIITVVFYMLFVFFNILIIVAHFSKQVRNFDILWKVGIPVKASFYNEMRKCFLAGTAVYMFVGMISMVLASIVWKNNKEIMLHLSNIVTGYIVIFTIVIVTSSVLYFYTKTKIER
ncbi:ABC transporter permease [Proteinivorax tanatarense]|uniref:ABC transporter permease n=1 Tax=Proteinivorax tanatarense TaxID=1260629 RepID=A0AAU7VNW1_9FIRM